MLYTEAVKDETLDLLKVLMNDVYRHSTHGGIG